MLERRNPMQARKANFRMAMIVFAIVLAALAGVLVVLYHLRENILQRDLRQLATNTANKVTEVITDRLWKADTLATLIVQGNGKMDDFEKIAAILVNDQAILNVSLAPNGIVSDIFPKTGNELVVGLDFLDSGGFYEALSARDTGRFTLAGPFRMVQGGEALTGRLPVFIKTEWGKHFWGFVGIALAYPGILQAAYIDELYQQGYAGQIWRFNLATAEKQIIWQSSEEPLDNPETREITLFNVTWYISVARLPTVTSYLIGFGYVLVAIFISLLTAMLAFNYLELRSMKETLDSVTLTDPLTGLPNRRSIMNMINDAIAAAKTTNSPFAIVYVDLENFQLVNETHGHEKGDYTLIQTAVDLKECLGHLGVVARVGGDEFMAVLPGFARGDQRLEPLLDAVRSRLQRTIHGKTAPVSTSAAIGLAFFPEDATSLTPLLKVADESLQNPSTFRPHFR